jgi:hypothetical protein
MPAEIEPDGLHVKFDGYLDLAVLNEFGAKWGRYKYWLWDTARKPTAGSAIPLAPDVCPGLLNTSSV